MSGDKSRKKRWLGWEGQRQDKERKAKGEGQGSRAPSLSSFSTMLPLGPIPNERKGQFNLGSEKTVLCRLQLASPLSVQGNQRRGRRVRWTEPGEFGRSDVSFCTAPSGQCTFSLGSTACLRCPPLAPPPQVMPAPLPSRALELFSRATCSGKNLRLVPGH